MRNKFNVTKLQMLYAVRLLTKHDQLANSHTVGDLLGKDRQFAGRQLNRLDPTYITALRDTKRTDGCTLKYKLTKVGGTRLDKMLIRFRRGESLKLTRAPYPVDYTGGELLPGLKGTDLYYQIEKEREKEREREKSLDEKIKELDDEIQKEKDVKAKKIRKATEDGDDEALKELTYFNSALQGVLEQERRILIGRQYKACLIDV